MTETLSLSRRRGGHGYSFPNLGHGECHANSAQAQAGSWPQPAFMEKSGGRRGLSRPLQLEPLSQPFPIGSWRPSAGRYEKPCQFRSVLDQFSESSPIRCWPQVPSGPSRRYRGKSCFLGNVFGARFRKRFAAKAEGVPSRPILFGAFPTSDFGFAALPLQRFAKATEGSRSLAKPSEA